MPNKLEELTRLIHEYGRDVDKTRTFVEVKEMACFDNIPTTPGVYWIETTMPVGELRNSISDVTGKEKRIRKKAAPGTTLIEQAGTNYYVVYSGTEYNLSRRLKQHLFNQGDEATAKLGCLIDKEPFSKYQWRVSFKEIESYEVRYAIESWWRSNIGWPVFCLKS